MNFRNKHFVILGLGGPGFSFIKVVNFILNLVSILKHVTLY